MIQSWLAATKIQQTSTLAMWVNPAMPKLEFPKTAKTHGMSWISTKRGLNSWESSSFPVPGMHAAKQCSFFTSSYWFWHWFSLHVVVRWVCRRWAASRWICRARCWSGVVRAAVAALVANHMKVHLWDLVAVVAKHPNLPNFFPQGTKALVTSNESAWQYYHLIYSNG